MTNVLGGPIRGADAIGVPARRPTRVQADPGRVLRQDISILVGLQRGLHQPGFTHLVLSNEERRVINVHPNLERYLELHEKDRITGGGPVDREASLHQ